MHRTSRLLALTFFAALAAVPTPASPFRVGTQAPEITLPSLADGSLLSLSDFRGQRLMLHVWASW